MCVFHEYCTPFVTQESTERVTILEGGSICTTLNTKLLVLLALCVWAKRQGTLEQEVNSVQTIPAGKCFRAHA